jgi:hypothetical protein
MALSRAVVMVVVHSFVGHGMYTQGDCDQLKKAQTDGSGRQIDAKMQADAQGNCEPKPPNSKEVEVPESEQAPRPPSR